MKTIINVECMDQDLIITNSPVIASGGVHENFIAFNFCEKWDGLGKTAVFYRNEKERFYSVLDSDDICEIPHEVTDYEGNMYFGVYGEAGDVTKTSKVLKYKINQGAMTTLLKPSEEPTPDIYQQLLSAYGQTNEAIAKETAEREASIMAEESARNNAINTAILAEENARKQADATEKTERQAEIAVERARIDQLTKMEEGSTTGDVELMDIRVDAGGQTHESAGDAVRSQYVALNTKIDDNVDQLSSEIVEVDSLFVVGGLNLFNPHDLMLNHAYRQADGTLVENEKYKCTPLIPLDNNYGCIHSSVRAYRFTWYDENGNWLVSMGERNTAWINDSELNNANAKYVGITYLIDDDLTNLLIVWNNSYNYTVLNSYEPFTYKISDKKVKGATQYNVNSDMFLEWARNCENSRFSINEVTGITEVTFVADKTTTHIQKVFPCMPCKLLLLEFMGKSSNIAYSPDYSSGAMLIIEFFDKNNNIIGSKYNGYVLGSNRCGYHKYGYVAPLGTAYAQLRVVTRGTTSITLHDVTITCMDTPTPNHNRGIKLDGHLGSILVAPKNTLPAFELGRLANFSNMITNCNMTKDGVLVALHDNTIDATSDGTGNVSDYTYEELQAFDFGSWFSPVYTGTKIPKLEDVVKTISMCGMGLIYRAHDSWYNAERESEVKQVYSWVKKYGQIGKASVKSFSTAVLDYMYTIMGNDVDYIYCGAYNSNTLTWAEKFGGKVCIELDYGSMTEEIATDIINAGFEASVYILNDVSKMRELVNIGVTRFCTDTYGDIIFPFD